MIKIIVRSKVFFTCAIVALGTLLLSFADYKYSGLPYKSSGLTESQAAAHLISRFTYGATPGQIEEVVKIGLEKWFLQQIDAGINDADLNRRLSSYNAINLSNTEAVNIYPAGPQVFQMALKEGFINKDSVTINGKGKYKAELKSFMQQKGLKPQREFFRQFINQKIVRAAYTNNQLQEVMTDFWFNHFNVSITKNKAAKFIPAFERDVIRPNSLGNFEDLLLATAKSPAMLAYLDNFISSGTNSNMKFPEANGQIRKKMAQRLEERIGDSASKNVIKKLQQAKKNKGLNENYAREVMELHTLGVDGGYTQEDVTNAAKVLTGWTIAPINNYGGAKAINKVLNGKGGDKLKQLGFEHDGDFLFAANRHDNSEKKVLGKTFAGGGGYEEGVELLKMLAHHPSTAKFISRKIAVRFVNDNPPQSLVNKMAKTFTEKNGDIKHVIITMVNSPEFWSKDAIGEKTKSPFELAISAVRSLKADIKNPYELYTWIDKMGQKIYFYQAPTGFPDKGQYWINTGSLLNRMNFGLALATGRISGIKLNLLQLNQGHEPESAKAALSVFSNLMLPERNIGQTIKQLTPLLYDPSLESKIDQAAGKAQVMQPENMLATEDLEFHEDELEMTGKKGKRNIKTVTTDKTFVGNNNMMAQVVGIIIGSPEFQRR